MTMTSKKMTIKNLTTIVTKGFENMATKSDIKNMATKSDIEALAIITAKGFAEVNEKFEKVDEDLREINMKLYDRDENVRRNQHRNTTRIGNVVMGISTI